ncbi:MAG: sulfatase [Akkermansiaceae bacterium]|jgi:arylsulfatase A-like enzyme|nr:sulfatase [Akkermansiaceae bacterium]
MIRVAWFPLFALLAGIPGSAQSETPSRQKGWNVLFIAVDDLRPELGCYGVEAVKTPCIDAFAGTAMTFRHHYVQVPTCGASRYALLTGRRASESRAMGNEVAFRGPTALPREMDAQRSRSLPEIFRRSGWRTGCIGKISHMPDGRVFSYRGKGDGRPELPDAWDFLETPCGPWKSGHGAFFAYSEGRHREDGGGYAPLYEFPDVADEALPDGMIARAAAAKLESWKDEAFFLAVGFFKPHLPWVAPKSYRDLYDDREVGMSPNPEKTPSRRFHGSGEFSRYQSDFPKKLPQTPAEHEEARKAYYAATSYVDAQVGLLLDKLRELGLEQRTIVILWGDHGWHLGDHGIWGKHTPFERSLNSPLIVRVPGLTPAGSSTEALVETVDLLPSLVDLCEPEMDRMLWPAGGVSLRPVLKDPAHPGKDGAMGYWGKSVTLRTARHRVIATRQGKDFTDVEIYDHREDPAEKVNIAARDPALRKALLDQLRRDQPVMLGE